MNDAPIARLGRERGAKTIWRTRQATKYSENRMSGQWGRTL